MTSETDNDMAGPTGAPGAGHGQVPLHDAHDLVEGGQQARITLNGMVYTLRITRQGKLILTK